jgi:4-hydroxy-3-polyprenylbenzoate decarboxylase
VDDDVDITNLSEVMWAVGTRCEPAEDVDLLRNTLSSPLDPRMLPEKKDRRDYTSSVMVVDATRPWAWRSEFPMTCDFSPEYRAKVQAKWAHVV